MSTSDKKRKGESHAKKTAKYAMSFRLERNQAKRAIKNVKNHPNDRDGLGRLQSLVAALKVPADLRAAADQLIMKGLKTAARNRAIDCAA